MTWAEVTYGLWAAIAAAALMLWLASVRAWRIGGAQIRRPAAALCDALDARTWLRVAVIVGWAWLGIHAFAR
jgi:hypothetical protein